MTKNPHLETDYLVIGAGLGGLAFADAMVDAGATVTVVDRQHTVGGHWVNAYPFVKLHQPSRLYGVPSMALGKDRIVEGGIDDGLYERATGAEILAYFDRLLHQRLLPSGQVTFLPQTEYIGEGWLRLLSSGQVQRIRVNERIVDARYLEGGIPATSKPPFEVADGVICVTPNELPTMDSAKEGYVVIGAGKTAMDTCQYLLDSGVDPERIRWVRARDLWLQNREHFQGGKFVAKAKEGVAIQLEAAAAASDLDDYYDRCADAGLLLAVDPDTRPMMIRGATSHAREIEQLRTIENVVRLGYVKRIERDRIVLDEGEVRTSSGWVHVHCAASALPTKPPVPVFQPGKITMQYVRLASPSFSFSLIGFLEASERTDAERNLLAAPNALVPTRRGWLQGTVRSFGQGMAWREHEDLRVWLDNRLNLMQGMKAARHTPEGQAVDARFRAAVGAGSAALMQLAREPRRDSRAA